MTTDVLIVGAGPAGLSLATGLAKTGAKVEIVDEQPAPGGQVYRASEHNAATPQPRGWLGPDYAKGADLVARARATEGIRWRMATSVWDIRPEKDGCELGLLCDGKVSVAAARHVVLATGAMERPTPFAGWTLPGVMSIGAAQTLFKESGLLPQDGVVLAGQGPLLYLFIAQILAAGIKPRAVLDFGPRWARPATLPSLVQAALASPGQIVKGLRLRAEIARAGVEHVYGVERIEALGDGAINRVSFRHRGKIREIETSLLLAHDGVIPNTHMSAAAGCALEWTADQAAWCPRLDGKGQSTRERVWVLGDGAGILGADAAVLGGRIMARDMARALGLPSSDDSLDRRGDRRDLRRLKRLRRFLDRQYPPIAAFAQPPDDTTICRCEAVKAGDIRTIARAGCMGPNQLRAFSRAGMGPCMGRQCGNAISQIMAVETGRSIAETGCFSIRTPLKPVTLAELASLKDDEQ
jgi:NADPH-dependent 2,4-dienoyl-CoA reductase/sulfur reductase-like enzyme